MSSNIEQMIEEISRNSCPSGGIHEPILEKKEEYPDGTIKYILACKKCKQHFEFER